MSSDSWTSLDERSATSSSSGTERYRRRRAGRRSSRRSESSSSSNSSSNSSSHSSSNSSNIGWKEKARQSRKSELCESNLSTRVNSTVSSAVPSAAPTPASLRKRAMDSLAKRRRVSLGLPEPEFCEEEFVDDSEADFIADSSPEDPEEGFYAKVSRSLDRKEQKESGSTYATSIRARFLSCVNFYALSLINTNPSRKIDPSLKTAALRIERDLISRRNSRMSTLWKPDALFVKTLNSYSEFRLQRHRRHWNEGQCIACPKVGYSAEARLGGDFYDSQSLWQGDVLKWLNELKLPFLGKVAKSGISSEESSDEDATEIRQCASKTWTLGGTCASHCEVYHALQHSKHFLLKKIYDYILKQGLRDPELLVKALKRESEGIVKDWFNDYKEVIKISERQFDTRDEGVIGSSPLRQKFSGSATKRRQSNQF